MVAGDTVAMGTVEYRFHLPRVLPLRPKPVSLPWFGTFRLAPQQVYGRADWDLILRLFVDGARAVKNDRISFEKNHTLLGAGAGVELQLKRNFRFRMDYGRALESVRTGDRDVSSGDDRYYFEMTVLY